MAMVRWWKRLFYSLISVVIGAGVCGGVLVSQQMIMNPHMRFSLQAWLGSIAFFDYWVVLLSLPGWLLAIPAVLLVRDLRRWRFWVYLALGSFIGPVLILGIAFYSAVRAPNFAGFPRDSMSTAYLAAGISFLTTLIYLLLLRRAQGLVIDRTAAA
jgi:hypothetical protein